MKQVFVGAVCLLPTAIFAQIQPAQLAKGDYSSVELPGIGIYSDRIAIQEPTATFAMPVSALRYEPLVDVQARNLAEGQSDVAIRGGTFENTGFKIGALSMYDPITGHFFSEIPVAPAMLGAPDVLTGTANALHSWNATTGTVAYQWRPIRSTGTATVSAGDYDTRRGEFYQGWRSGAAVAGQVLAVDASIASSRSDGSQPFGEHAFDRTNVRLQLSGEVSQTDLFYGYQAKSFGWPNLYTPYRNVFETDSLQTALLALNHRQDLGNGDYLNAGVYYRRNKDHYVFNRADPGAYNPAFATGPSFHTGWVAGGGLDGSWTSGEVKWTLSGTFIADKIRSTSLNFGRHQARDQYKVAVAPQRTWVLADGREFTAETGLSWDDSNRTASAYSPVARLELGRLAPLMGIDSVYLSYAKTTQLPTYFATNSRASAGLFRGNPNLGREVAHTVESGVKVGRGAWNATAAVFYRKDDNLVDWTYSSSLPNARAANAVDIGNVGVEVVARYTSKPIDLVLGYTGLGKDADYGLTTVDASFYALNYARHRFTAALTWRLPAGFELHMDNEVRLQKKDALRVTGDEAYLSALGLFYSPVRVRGLRLGVEVENLWDSDFQEVPAVPAAKRQISGSLSYSW